MRSRCDILNLIVNIHSACISEFSRFRIYLFVSPVVMDI